MSPTAASTGSRYDECGPSLIGASCSWSLVGYSLLDVVRRGEDVEPLGLHDHPRSLHAGADPTKQHVRSRFEPHLSRGMELSWLAREWSGSVPEAEPHHLLMDLVGFPSADSPLVGGPLK
jgi:hypothetical protein